MWYDHGVRWELADPVSAHIKPKNKKWSRITVEQRHTFVPFVKGDGMYQSHLSDHPHQYVELEKLENETLSMHAMQYVISDTAPYASIQMMADSTQGEYIFELLIELRYLGVMLNHVLDYHTIEMDGINKRIRIIQSVTIETAHQFRRLA